MFQVMEFRLSWNFRLVNIVHQSVSVQKRCKSCKSLAKANSDYCRPCGRRKTPGDNQKKSNSPGREKKGKKAPPPKGSTVESSTIQTYGRVKKRWKRVYTGKPVRSADYLTRPGESWTPTFRRNIAAEEGTQMDPTNRPDGE